MKKNVGSIDKIVRIIVGIALLAAYAMDRTQWWGLIGVIPLATALMGWCPLYSLIGANTGAKASAHEQ